MECERYLLWVAIIQVPLQQLPVVPLDSKPICELYQCPKQPIAVCETPASTVRFGGGGSRGVAESMKFSTVGGWEIGPATGVHCGGNCGPTTLVFFGTAGCDTAASGASLDSSSGDKGGL